MAILRHRHTCEFTILPNATIRDRSLSLKGVGLLCTMLSLPEGWNFSTAGLCAICFQDGRDSICSGLKELESARYLVRKQIRTPDGKTAGVEWIVSDTPILENDSPNQAFPDTAFPDTEKTQQIKDRPKKGKKEKEYMEASPTRSRFVPPCVDEVRAYCQERHNHIDAQRFVDYYAAAGWTRGKTKIKDWRACVRTWERAESSKRQNNAPDYSAYQEESL